MRDGYVFALIGLGDRRVAEGEALDSCSSIIMHAGEVMKSLHECMPTIIVPVPYDLWLNAIMTYKAEPMDHLNSAPYSQLLTHPVSP